MKFDTSYLDRMEQKIFIEGTDLREQGHKIIGMYCAFTPKEIVAAAGAIPVALCAGSLSPVAAAEQHLPRNLCPLIKASYGHALEQSCPYFNSCDYLFADATCDGKKKMFELLSRIKPLHLLQLPQTSDTGESLEYWKKELLMMTGLTEEITGNRITDDLLLEQIRLYNRYRRAVLDIFEMNRGDVPLLYGSEIDAITGAIGYDCNIDERIKELEHAAGMISSRKNDQAFIGEISSKPKILITGCPTTNKKVFDLIEECGAVIVAMENCGGLKTAGLMVREDIDPLTALAERYLNIPCPCMTPNTSRLSLIDRLIDEYNADGVIELTWQGCHTYNIEAFMVKEHVTGICGKHYIQIETDYGKNDISQIKTRIEAFLELI